MQIGHGKQGVIIGEYGCERAPKEPKRQVEAALASSDQNAILGWVEPACERPQWIIWFTRQGDAIVYRQRETGGAVRGEPLRLKAQGLGGADPVFYGPHACHECGSTICKASREDGGEAYDYPEGPIYPNSQWNPHVCQQRDIERLNSLRNIGWRGPGDPPPTRPGNFDTSLGEGCDECGNTHGDAHSDNCTRGRGARDAIRMYSDSEVRTLLKKAQERGLNMEKGSPIDNLTIAELDELLA